MSSYRRNVLVGGTVLGAMIVLAWMILRFGGSVAEPFAAARMPIRLVADRVDGLDEGSAVTYRGVRVGQVKQLTRAENQREVYIDAEVNTSPPLPANLEGQIRAQGLLSAGTMVSLEMPQSQTAAASVPQGQLQARAILPARFVGLEVVPREYAELAEELRKTSREFRDSGLVGHLDETVRATKLQIEKVGKVLDSVAELVEDKKIREDLRTSLANISRASETTTRISANLEKLSVEATGTVSKAQGHMDDLAKQLGARMEQLSKVLESFQSIAGKIDQGKGTAGLLVNDTRLYEGLVDTTRQLKLTIGDMRRLLEQWEQEGVTLRIQK